MNKELLYYTDDNGISHLLADQPTLIGLNFTEWWWLKEIMETQKCNYKTSDHNELIVTTPSGDRYEIIQWIGIVTYVQKL